MDADGGEEQELLAIIDKSDDSLYNSNDSESGDSFVRRLHCPTIPLSTISICSIDCSRAEVSPNDSSGSDHGVIMTHADYSPTNPFDTERLTVESQYFSREEMISVLRL